MSCEISDIAGEIQILIFFKTEIILSDLNFLPLGREGYCHRNVCPSVCLFTR